MLLDGCENSPRDVTSSNFGVDAATSRAIIAQTLVSTKSVNRSSELVIRDASVFIVIHVNDPPSRCTGSCYLVTAQESIPSYLDTSTPRGVPSATYWGNQVALS